MSRLNKLDVLGILQEHGAIVSGHYQLPSGWHSPTYVQTAAVLQYPHIAQTIAKALSAKFPGASDVVLSPALGAVIVGQEVARARKCRSIFAERTGGKMSLQRDFDLKAGERVLIVEDVLTTGRSTSEVVALAAAYGAKVIGVAAIVDRSTAQLPLAVPVRALVTFPVKVFPPERCEMCARSVPISKGPRAGEPR